MTTNSISPLVSIITVNYNTADVTRQLLQSLQQVTYTNIEVIVVDNASQKDASFLKEEFPHITFIQNKTNEGFAGGNNRGIEKAKGEIIFLLNNDTEVAPSFIEPVVALFAIDASIGIISSKLIYYNSNQTIQYAGATPLNPFTTRGKFIGSGKYDNGLYEDAAPTHLAHGAAMAIHRKVIDKIGLLPEMYFLYYEELDFAYHAKRSGFSIWCQPKSVVFHKESMSVGKMSGLKVYYMNRNRLLFIRRNIFGMTGVISRMFFVCVSAPSAMIKYILQGKWNFAENIYKGLIWNLKY